MLPGNHLFCPSWFDHMLLNIGVTGRSGTLETLAYVIIAFARVAPLFCVFRPICTFTPLGCMDARTLPGSQATLLTAAISSSYVLSVFLSALIAKPGPPLWRNDPKVIEARSLLATASTLLSCFVVYLTVRSYSNEMVHQMSLTFT